MLEKYSLLEQAEHNKILCLIIFDLKTHNDWVVTTAFYSALHFVKHYLFPLVIDDYGRKKAFSNFNDYIVFRRKEKDDHSSPHSLLSDLVFNYIPDEQENYDFLLNASMDSRYNLFKVPDNACEKVITRLNLIEEKCKSKKKFELIK